MIRSTWASTLNKILREKEEVDWILLLILGQFPALAQCSPGQGDRRAGEADGRNFVQSNGCPG